MQVRKIIFKVIICLTIYLMLSSCQKSTMDFSLEYKKYELENGLDVILHKDKSDPIVAIAILFHVGSNREKPGKTGFAHFFEHMLFQASENVGKGRFFKLIDELGGTFNGGTWNDGTVYYEVIPKDALEKMLWIESDRMGFMINTVSKAALENEKKVVKNEKRQSVDNQPYGHTNFVIHKALYPEGHPYNWQVIGSLEDLQNATVQDVKDFYEKWYGPNNATMVIAGDIDFEDVEDMVDKYFSEIPAKAEVEPLPPNPSKLSKTLKFVHEDNFAKLPEMTMVFPTVEDGHPDAYPLDYLGELLSIGKRAPLYKTIVEDRKLAPKTYTYNLPREIAGNFYFKIKAKEDIALDTVYQAVIEALQNFEKNGIDERDMDRIKTKLETDFYNSIEGVLYKAFQLVRYNEFRGTPDALKDEIRKIMAVRKDDVLRVYEKYIKDKPCVITSFVPKGKMSLALSNSQIAAIIEEEITANEESLEQPVEEISSTQKTPSKIDRSIEPKLGEMPKLSIPTIWSDTMSNQLKVFGIENNELPLVRFSLRIKGGMLMDNMEKIGTSNLLTDVMMEGTLYKTPEELEDAMGQLGTEIGIYTSAEGITLYGRCLSRHFDEVFNLFEEILLAPRWDEKEFQRLKAKTITIIKQKSVQPNYVSNTVFKKLIYGEENILANAPIGTIESVEKINMADLKTYYKNNFSPNISAFHIVGSISEEKVKKRLNALTQKWSAKEVNLPILNAPKPIEKAQLYFVDIPKSKLSVIRIGSPFVNGKHPDFYKGVVVNERLGGSGAARLFQQLREEKGYTYGAYSRMPRRINTSYFNAYSNVRSNVTLEAMQIFQTILNDYQADFSKEDLKITQNSLIKRDALRFETLKQKIGILENISTYEMPKNYIEQNQKTIVEVTLPEAKELIGKYIAPSKMIYLVVGDAKTQAHKLKRLGLGEPIFLNKSAQEIMPSVVQK